MSGTQPAENLPGPVIRIEGFSHKYQATEAVATLTWEVTAGTIHGLIGPDSAGKTTLLRAVCSLLEIPAGRVWVFGLDVRYHPTQIRRRIGYMPQRFSLYQDLSVEQNLRFFGRLFGIWAEEYAKRSRELLRFSRLEQFKERRAAALSGGMKQKLALSCALIHQPELLILDEPTFGVDPVSRREFWDILRELNRQGTTILVSTPYMDEAEQCDRVTLLHKGRVLLEGKPGEIIAGWQSPLYSLRAQNPRQLDAFLRRQPEVCSLQLFGAEIHLTARQEIPEETFRLWQGANPGLSGWQRIPAGMEDVFLELMERDQDR